ncbi:hypothetical protein [Natronosalvus vescus]|uniref:hypothetical protein n=1 Tax=Natronosalvus vescus TaxID=2953881 RepID=UPI0020912767|nr:hypothetical protein [Natronosalvus vescus]
MDYLADTGLMAYGQRDPTALTDRNSDRVRVLQYLARHPEGVSQTALCHYVLKGVAPNDYTGLYDLSGDAFERHDNAAQYLYDGRGDGWTALDGSDDDFQFLNRFVNDLEAHTELIRVDRLDADETHGRWVAPTHRLIDLISEGIRETTSVSNDLVYDRDFAQNLLKTPWPTKKGLTTHQKKFLAAALRRYISRVNDYRLVFDVMLQNRSGHERRRMVKDFSTRFTSEGRISKNYARLQAALEWGYENADNAVFCTLTTWPENFDSHWDATQNINPNFHNLTQFFKTDPKTVEDTRKTHVPQWSEDLDSSNFHFGAEGAVSGRPRKQLQYVKVLEWDSGGKPHLHVLFFNVPTREKDGMPWLIDKAELEYLWQERYGQARIVDLYPLVYRDDLDEVGNFGEEFIRDDDGQILTNADGNPAKQPVSEGFVSWYRYGDHDWTDEQIEERVRFHKENGQIDFDGHEDVARQKTAGSYIGKYVSETLGTLREASAEIADDPMHFPHDVDDDDKAAFWKLGLYWATGRQFWSCSQGIRDDIALEDADRKDILTGVVDVSTTSLLHHAEHAHEPHALYPDLDAERAKSLIHRETRQLLAEKELAAQRSTTSTTTLAQIKMLGTFHWDDIPATPDRRIDPGALEEAIHDRDDAIVLAATGDNPPPVSQVW